VFNSSISSIQFNVEKFEKLTVLDLSKKQLFDLPSQLSVCKNLQKLDLSHNYLKFLPQSLQNLTNLVRLDISHNEISHGAEPKILDCEDTFESIYTEAELQSTTNRFDSQQSLKSTDSGFVDFPELPDFSCLKNLTWINISYNQVKFIPPELGQLKARYLNLANNQITVLPESFPAASSLINLDISYNHLTDLPPWLDQLSRCAQLVLAGNNIANNIIDVRDNFGRKCRRLKWLDLRNCGLRTLPEGLTSLLDLHTLQLDNRLEDNVESPQQYHNSLWSLPLHLTRLVGLVELEANNVNLTDLPENLGLLRNLRHLSVADNQLTWLPSTFIKLGNLQYCNIANNSLFMLPHDIENMTSLTHLLVSHNQISEIPAELKSLARLETLDLFNNRILVLPAYLLKMENLIRLDMAGNDFDQRELEKMNQDLVPRYEKLEQSLRQWAELPKKQAGERRADLMCEPRPEGLQSEFNSDYCLKADSAENVCWDDSGDDNSDDDCDKSDNIVLCDGDNIDDNSEDDWESGEKGYPPIKSQLRHNLDHMHLEAWWGRDQFCPSDLHVESNKNRLQKKRENEFIRHVGKRGGTCREFHKNSFVSQQFDDAAEV
jgi:Leucine-rich repeat (LRR) protein